MRARIRRGTEMKPSEPLHCGGVPPFAGRHAVGLAEPAAEVRGVGEAPVSGYRGDGLSASARARQLVAAASSLRSRIHWPRGRGSVSQSLYTCLTEMNIACAIRSAPRSGSARCAAM